jgi:hypothetical protein
MAAENELFIYLRFMAEQAEEASRAYHQGEQQRIRQTAAEQTKSDSDFVLAMKTRANAIAALSKASDQRRAVEAREEAALSKKLDALDKQREDSRRASLARTLKDIQANLKAAEASEAGSTARRQAIIKDLEQSNVAILRQSARDQVAIDKNAVAERASARLEEKADNIRFQRELREIKAKGAAEIASIDEALNEKLKGLKHDAFAEEYRDQMDALKNDRRFAQQRKDAIWGNWKDESEVNRLRQLEFLKRQLAFRTQAGLETESVKRLAQRLGLERQLTAESTKQVGVTKQLAEGTTALMGAFAGIGAVVSGLSAISRYYAQIREDTAGAVREMVHFREQVLALAAMKDRLGDSTTEAADQMRFRAQTAQTKEAALGLSQAAEGAGQAAIGANITREAFEEGKVTAGRVQAMENSDAGAIGDLYGTYALEARKGATGKELGAKFAQGFAISQPGRFRTTAEFANQRSQVSPYVQTGVISSGQADALVSAFSLVNKEQSATLTRQALNAVTADFLRNRRMKLLPGQENETSAEYFQKTLSLKEDTTPMQRLRAVADDLNKQQDLAQKAGKQFNANDYLLKHSVLNQESRQAYMAFAGLVKSGQWDKKFSPMIDKQFNANDINQRHQNFLIRDPVGKQRQAEMARDASTAMRANSPIGLLESLQRQEFEKLKAQKKITGTFEEWQKRDMLGTMSDDVLYGGFHSQVNTAVTKRLTESAKRAGINSDEINYGRNVFGGRVHRIASEQQQARFAQKLEAAGVNPLEESAKMLMQAATMMVDAAKQSIDAAKQNKAANRPPQVQAPLPAQPRVQAR